MAWCRRCCAIVALLLLLTPSARAAEWSLLPTAGTTELTQPTPADAESEPDFAAPASNMASVLDWNDPCSDTYCPRWTVWAGAIFLTRNSPSTQVLAVDGGANSILNAQAFNFGTGAGVDLNALRHGDVYDVDFRYFQVNGMSAHEQLFPPGGSAALPFGNPVALFPIPRLDAYYTTQIQSVELNLRKNLAPRFTVLAGFRYIALDDDLQHQFNLSGDGFSIYHYNIDAINRLYGGQIGLDAVVFSRGRFQVETAAKAGIYGNTARNALRISVFELPTVTVGGHSSPTSFVGDWNFSGIFQLNEHWALRGGYQLLWLSGVALSTQQYPYLSPTPWAGQGVATNGDLFLHGALASIQARW